MANPIWTIIEASIATMIEFSIGIFLGILISHKRVGLLSNPVVLRTLSKTLIYFFLPCYIVRSFAVGTDFAILARLIMIPVGACVIQLLQFLLGELFFSRLIHLKHEEEYRRICSLSVIFNNYTFFPIVFLSSLVEQSGIFPGVDASERSVIYVSLYAIPCRIFFFSFGLSYIASLKGKKDDPKEKDSEDIKPILGESHDENFLKRTWTVLKTQHLKLWRKGGLKKFLKFLKNVFSPPILAIIIGMGIAVIPPLQKFLFTDPPMILKGLPSILLKVGLVVKSVPNLVVGANIGRLFWEKWDTTVVDENKTVIVQKLQRFRGLFVLRHVKAWDLLKMIVLKLIAVPLIVLVIVFVVMRTFGPYVFPNEDERSLQYMLFIVESTTPHIVALPILLSLYDVGIYVISEIMLVTYLVAPITMTLFTIFGTYFVCSFEKCNL